MSKFFRHFIALPFVVATGFSALVHSTWSLATMFNGHEPVQFTGAWFAWVIPALLIALSIDIGQMVTATEISGGHRNRAKLTTFAVFSIATYLLQWYHLAHHAPLLPLAEGVRDEWLGFAQLLSDSMLWFVPALLPASTLLYTFSHSVVPEQVAHPAQTNITQAVQVNIEQPRTAKIEAPVVQKEQRVEQKLLRQKTDEVLIARPFEALCPVCGWSKVYETELGVKRAMVAHKPHCKGQLVDEQIAVMEGQLA